jgi:hypothetical protein
MPRRIHSFVAIRTKHIAVFALFTVIGVHTAEENASPKHQVRHLVSLEMNFE